MVKTVGLCVRLCVLGFALTSFLALIVSWVSSTSASGTAVWNPRAEVLSSPTTSGVSVGPEQHYLIEGEFADPEPIQLPEGRRWGLLSVSPWAGGASELEAVAACYRATGDGGEPFWGLTRVGLRDGKILDEVPLDLLPTGRPCWLPDRPGKVVFAAGDGRLYAYDFLPGQRLVGDTLEADPAAAGSGGIQAVEWGCNSPESGNPHITDPYWPVDSRFRRMLVATLIPQGGTTGAESTRLCWLRIDPESNRIEAAGLLRHPGDSREGKQPSIMRFPVVAADEQGELHLVYLVKSAGIRTCRMESLALEFDRATGTPRVAPGAKPIVEDPSVAMTPLAVSPEGTSVYSVGPTGGRPVWHHIGSQTRLASRTSASPGLAGCPPFRP